MPGSKSRFKALFAGPRWMAWPAWILLLAMGIWWVATFASARPPKLIAASPYTFTMPRYEFLGLDFIHDYAALYTWKEGGDPYGHLVGDPMNVHYLPAPPTLLFFLWSLALPADYVVTVHDPSALFPQAPYPYRAIVLWFLLSIVMFVFVAYESWRVRAALGLSFMPVQSILALTLVSYPVMFELERGNFNVLALLMVALGALPWALRKRPAMASEVLLGIGAAFSGALKIFPLIFFPGLIMLRRYVAAAAMLLTLALLWIAMWTLSEHWSKIVSSIVEMRVDFIPFDMHSLSFIWQHLWHGTSFEHISSGIGALALIAVPAGIVSGFVFFSPRRDRVLFPFLVWLAALGTWAMMISVDYNLLFLVVATLMLWDRQDPLWLQLVMLPWLLVWQPFLLVSASVSGTHWVAALFLCMKAWSVLAVGFLLIWRMHKLNDSCENQATVAGQATLLPHTPSL